MSEDDGDLGVITLVAAAASMIKLARELVSPTSGESTMVAIPSDMEIYVLIAAVAFAFFFGICAFLYRYAEHNAKHDLDRESNKLFGKGGLKFVGAELMAIALTAVLSFYGAAVTPGKLGIIDPALVDYILAAGVIALIAGILLTVLFNEGISGLGKFIRQKAEEAVKAADDISQAVKLTKKQKKQLKEMEEMQKLQDLLAASKTEVKPAEAAPLEEAATPAPAKEEEK